MARPLRLEFPGAVYHITARGDRQEPIFDDNDDRLAFLDLLGKEVQQQGWVLYAFCLMGNHYHLLLETAASGPALLLEARAVENLVHDPFDTLGVAF